MNPLNIDNMNPIDIDKDLNKFAFDGCNYYFTLACECRIVKTDTCFKTKKYFETCRVYDAICYDPKEHCFWASSKKYCNKLFKLNCRMFEIDCISVACNANHGNITGLSYNCCNNSLIVSFANLVIEVKKQNHETNILYLSNGESILSVLSISPGYIISSSANKKQYIRILDKCGKQIDCLCLKTKDIIKDMLFNPCVKCKKHFIVFLIMKCGCYPHLCKHHVSSEELGYRICCENFKVCKNCCDENTCDERDTYADVMESVALMEAALSHILNAEGEKLQKVLKDTNDVDKLISVNKEINKTIINATHLEHVLHAKLMALTDSKDCFKDKKDKCKCDEKSNS